MRSSSSTIAKASGFESQHDEESEDFGFLNRDFQLSLRPSTPCLGLELSGKALTLGWVAWEGLHGLGKAGIKASGVGLLRTHPSLLVLAEAFFD